MSLTFSGGQVQGLLHLVPCAFARSEGEGGREDGRKVSRKQWAAATATAVGAGCRELGLPRKTHGLHDWYCWSEAIGGRVERRGGTEEDNRGYLFFAACTMPGKSVLQVK
jgi:hypothetical protein